jgi:hypothetical protein
MVCERHEVAQRQEVGPPSHPVPEGLPSWSELDRAPRASLAVLVLANMVHAAGVLVAGWELGLILLLYWLESAVILGFSLAKLAVTSGRAAVAAVPFFLVHAGLFMAVHLLFLLGLFVELPAGGWRAWKEDLGLGVAVFTGSHLASFVLNFRGRRESYPKGSAVMRGFYARIVVMHLTILGGAMLVFLLGSSVFALFLLIVLKSAADAVAHLRERAKAAPKEGAAEAPPVDAPPS